MLSLKNLTFSSLSIPDDKKKFGDDKLSFLLISEYHKRKILFDDDKHRASSLLYSEIMKVFHSKGYTKITALDLSNRMDYLANEFKKRYDMLKLTGTGNEARNWTFFYVMGQIWEGSVVLEPQKLLSFGSTKMIQLREN